MPGFDQALIAPDEGGACTEPLAPALCTEPLQRAISFDSRALKEPINHSSNVLLLHRLNELTTQSCVNFTLAILSLVYIGVNIVCIPLNALNNNDDDCGEEDSVFIARCGSPVSDYVFHNVEFWATFAFAVVEAVALVYSPKSITNIYENPLVLKTVLFFDIAAAFVPAFLVALNLERFETVSHEMEYSNEITMTFVDMVLLTSLIRSAHARGDLGADKLSGSILSTGGMVAVSALIAIVQMSIYNGMGETEDGGKIGEKAAHYCEFSFEIISAVITFWFCMDNKLIADETIRTIVDNHDHCCNTTV